ncbi:mechanosensitive ion channel family protein [Noviherbaspirillum aridicola]|uniref:Mechanosensitive ion channel protein MscS n=1 Tax=Noviherbaspirillum aridicola TaxID=2849687 RepID=A0ABQ4QB25_9BURK|nr:mechanosensitive ion channel domain-containing protein [Noviherbaspirillum aridicola]GIZ53884.1 mechanosensitive ion channel protein MscS [Noviherbaspirillum aridicola]
MTEAVPDWSSALGYAVIPWIVLVRQLPWIHIVVQLLIALPPVLLLHGIATRVLARLAQPLPYSRRLLQYGHRAVGVLIYLLIVQVILRSAPDDIPGLAAARHVTGLVIVCGLTWLGLRCVRAVSHTIIELHPADTPDNLHARRIQTQTRVLARSVMALIVMIGAGTALSTLPLLREIGTSLLASAGVAGLVVGFAAKPVLGNLLAGMQIALTQPIRLDDVVIVQNEWGQIEEITGTYVVVRIWDQRRMIVPLQWFIENPFQNWTRTNSEILGTVSVWVDYAAPVGALREQAERLCRESPEWDGRLCITQVVETSERAMQIRILVSAADAGRAWDLRCRVREGLLGFLQREYPGSLPRVRAELDAA